MNDETKYDDIISHRTEQTTEKNQKIATYGNYSQKMEQQQMETNGVQWYSQMMTQQNTETSMGTETELQQV